MDFAPHLRTLFQLRGKAAVYTPGSGVPVPCRAIRQGGGQPFAVGPVMVMLERVQFHVRRAEIPAPVAGAVLAVGTDVWTVQAVQPVERDAEGLLWCLDVAWGVAVVYRTAAAAGGVQGGPFSIVSPMAAGAASVSIQSQYVNAAGKLQPGDRLSIGGVSYTVGAAVAASASKAFNNIPIAPPLAAAVAASAPVGITQAAAPAFPLAGAMADYTASEVAGAVLAGDRRLVVLQAAFVAAGLPAGPVPGATVEVAGRSYGVVTVTAVFQGSAVAAWILQVR